MLGFTQVGQQWAEEGYVDAVAFAHLPGDPAVLAKVRDHSMLAGDGDGHSCAMKRSMLCTCWLGCVNLYCLFLTHPQAGDVHRCRKCRRLLLTQRNVLNIDEACLGHRIFRARGAKVARTGPDEGTSQQGGLSATPSLNGQPARKDIR
jgi:hypothetical protein